LSGRRSKRICWTGAGMWTRNNLRKRLVGIVVIAMICLISIAVFLSHHQKAGKEMKTPLMNPRPGELFYYTFWYGFGLVPKIDRSSITDYAGLILKFAYFRAKFDEKDRLVYEEIWNRERQDVPGDLVINGMKVLDIPV